MAMKKIFLLLTLSCYSYGSQVNTKIKVCVIGAGSAGISVTRHLVDYLDKLEITVFEKSSEVGGLWLYTDKTGFDEYGNSIHSSMYKNLRVNLPKELMNYPDWPQVRGENRSCVSHFTIEEYLKSYTDHFQLRPFIKLNSIVEKVKLQKDGSVDKWKVTVRNYSRNKTNKYIFDAVIICNGHFFEPFIPEIPGLENFTGQILHSHNYRKPENYRNKSVIVLGAGNSGIDIAKDLVNFTSKLYLSHNHEHKPISINQVKGVHKFENGEFVLKDNKSIRADCILFCTGYNYTYPFLDETSGIKVHNNFVSPLYKHMFNIEHPSMSFVGIPTGLVAFPQYSQQAQFIVSVLINETQLPPIDVMKEEYARISFKRRHTLDSWNYTDELARMSNFEPLPEYYKIGHRYWHKHKDDRPDNYKDYNLVIGNDNKSVTIVKMKQDDINSNDETYNLL